METHANSIQKQQSGAYEVVLRRGDGFRQPTISSRHSDSPLAEPLRSIGLDESGIARVLQQFPQSAVREWTDITLAAQERFGRSFFKRSPVAYLLDNLKKSVSCGRTPPDWWHDVRKAEDSQQAERDRQRSGRSQGTSAVPAASRRAFEQIRGALFQQLRAAGLNEESALREATRRAQQSNASSSRSGAAAPVVAGTILASLPIKRT